MLFLRITYTIPSLYNIPSMDENHLHHPLLSLATHANTTTTTSTATGVVSQTPNDTSSNFGLPIRLLVVLLFGFISIWANHEASKGFPITVVNNIKDTPAGDKFTLFYISNDEAIRLVQSSSSFAANVLFTGTPEKKLIDQVDVHLVSHNLTNVDHTVAVKFLGQKRKFVLSINPNVMDFVDFKYRIRKEIQRGMAEILLLSQQIRAPETLLDGMVEYVSDLAGFSGGFSGPNPVFKLRDFSEKCWEDKDPRIVAKFLEFCVKKSEGFVGRLNQEIKRDGWSEKMMGEVLGKPAIHFCLEFHDSMIKE